MDDSNLHSVTDHISKVTWPSPVWPKVFGAYITHNATQELSDKKGDNLSDDLQIPALSKYVWDHVIATHCIRHLYFNHSNIIKIILKWFLL